MVAPKSQPPKRGWTRKDVERIIILGSCMLMMIFLIVDGVLRNEIDRGLAIGVLATMIGYFAKELTGQKDTDQ